MMRENKDKGFIPFESLAKNAVFLEQYVESVVDVTSKYNHSYSISYCPHNIVGQPEIFPKYGDFSNAYMLKTYGRCWRGSEGDQEYYMPQGVDPLGAEDFITIRFATHVAPRELVIYETYNPGAVVRIWGRFTEKPWKLLWEGAQELCPEEPRKFSPTIRHYNCLMNEIRLEFNHSHLRYHSSFDAVMLRGFHIPSNAIMSNVLLQDLWESVMAKRITENVVNGIGENGTGDNIEEVKEASFFQALPYEVLIQIFMNLDLQSLCRCTQVNRVWLNASRDANIYASLNLKRYWHKVDVATFEFYSRRCKNRLRKLDLSWCGFDNRNEFAIAFCAFIEGTCVPQLTHLALNHCRFVDDASMQAVAKCTELVDLRLEGLRNAEAEVFAHLTTLTNLVSLDVSSTKITDPILISILRKTPQLQHLNIDLCEAIAELDSVIEVVRDCNKKLRTWSSWKVLTLTPAGAATLGSCQELREINLGWCLSRRDPRNCLEDIAFGCTHLKKLIISQWQGINDQMLMPLIRCRHLVELDLLGIIVVSNEVCDAILCAMPNLRYLDVTFCDAITREQVMRWQDHFPRVRIRSTCDALE